MQALRVLDPGRPRPAQPAITSGLAPGTRPDSPPNGEETRLWDVSEELTGVRLPLGATADTTQRFTFYPDFSQTSAYRSEAEITAQAAMNARLALKLGYLLRYSNDPVPTFKKTDNTMTASVVVRWKAATPAPAP